MTTDQDTKVSGKTISDMVRAFFITVTVANMKASVKMMLQKGMVCDIGQMGLDMKVNGRITKNTEEGNFTMRLGKKYMKEDGKITKSTELEYLGIKMGVSMLVNGQKIKNMVRGDIFILMVLDTKASGNTIRHVVMGYFIDKMAINYMKAKYTMIL
jgi:hypothetical protein